MLHNKRLNESFVSTQFMTLYTFFLYLRSLFNQEDSWNDIFSSLINYYFLNFNRVKKKAMSNI